MKVKYVGNELKKIYQDIFIPSHSFGLLIHNSKIEDNPKTVPIRHSTLAVTRLLSSLSFSSRQSFQTILWNAIPPAIKNITDIATKPINRKIKNNISDDIDIAPFKVRFAV